ncbi:hypothetical protein KC323_g5361 [Hortaea werneckii]|uniref:Uncharacterized protein n=1 Tax=Hortaea werneckii TaxID=91943 RepID=A0A3M7DZ15_HORWE|nr:hypothetical protein KC323_g5361 [Hortaea werneckii]KAI7349042.1 hypothetical protein KC320_g6298 [Hortaea werneckii]RMY69186.1 hypothetical protein D0863_06625 [Hortaea werneckii]RMZ05459.1 hypothetical protein D0862_04963 [Hortaea werneckii]
MAAIGDHDNHTLATPEGSQKPCGLLELPPELRNNIYELCFESAVDDKRANFNAPTPPGFAILQTCRQIHDEAIQIYQVADRKYWSNTHFWIEEKTYEQAKASAESMRPEKICLINKVTIAVPIKEDPGIEYLTREPISWGVAWTKSLEPGNSPELYKLVVLYEKEEQVQRVEHKCLTKQELLETLPALNKYYWAIAK